MCRAWVRSMSVSLAKLSGIKTHLNLGLSPERSTNDFQKVVKLT